MPTNIVQMPFNEFVVRNQPGAAGVSYGENSFGEGVSPWQVVNGLAYGPGYNGISIDQAANILLNGQTPQEWLAASKYGANDIGAWRADNTGDLRLDGNGNIIYKQNLGGGGGLTGLLNSGAGVALLASLAFGGIGAWQAGLGAEGLAGSQALPFGESGFLAAEPDIASLAFNQPLMPPAVIDPTPSLSQLSGEALPGFPMPRAIPSELTPWSMGGPPPEVLESAGAAGGLPARPVTGIPDQQVPAPVVDRSLGLSTPFTGSIDPVNFLAGLAKISGVAGSSSFGGFLPPWAKSGLDIGSGIYGLLEHDRQKKLAERAFRAQDPFGDQRGMYQQQLAQLMQDPNYLTQMPGYQFGLDEGRRAIMRRGAASGGGGNEAIALARYTPEYAMNFRNQELARLANLAGAGISPSGGGVLLAGNQYGSDLVSRSLASIGYGLSRAAF